MEEDIIKKYFDISIKVENKIPTFNIRLKPEMKIRTDLPLKCVSKDGRKVCQTGNE